MKGTFQLIRSDLRRVVVEIETRPDAERGPELSVCASHYERASAAGAWRDAGGGQMYDRLQEIEREAAKDPGYVAPPVPVARVLEVWQRWHLNHMHAGCEHQRASWDTAKRITFDLYSIDWDDRRGIQRQMENDRRALGLDPETPEGRRPYGSPAQARGPLTPTAREEFRRYSHAAALLFTLDSAGVKPFAWSAIKDGRAVGVLGECFEIIEEHELAAYREQVIRHRQGNDWTWKGRRRSSNFGPAPKPPVMHRTETKTAGWLRPEEHAEGLLCKPCEVCGYKYGSRWLSEPLPDEIVAEVTAWCAGVAPIDPKGETFAALGLQFSATRAKSNPNMAGEFKGASHWACKFSSPASGRALEVFFSQGAAFKDPPTGADVFECLLDDARGAADTFKEWAANMGEEVDSRSAERTYRTIARQTRGLRDLLGAERLAALLT